jgi:hypothetical protein
MAEKNVSFLQRTKGFKGAKMLERNSSTGSGMVILNAGTFFNI